MVNAIDRAANAVSQNDASKKKVGLDAKVGVSSLSGEASNISSSGPGTWSYECALDFQDATNGIANERTIGSSLAT